MEHGNRAGNYPQENLKNNLENEIVVDEGTMTVTLICCVEGGKLFKNYPENVVKLKID